MDAGPFQPFPLADEFGPSVFGEAASGADLNRWWIPFPPPEGKQFVGRLQPEKILVDLSKFAPGLTRAKVILSPKRLKNPTQTGSPMRFLSVTHYI